MAPDELVWCFVVLLVCVCVSFGVRVWRVWAFDTRMHAHSRARARTHTHTRTRTHTSHTISAPPTPSGGALSTSLVLASLRDEIKNAEAVMSQVTTNFGVDSRSL